MQKIFAEGVRDKIFDTETVAALGCALRHKDSNVRSGAVKIFTAAIAQGALHCIHGTFIPKYWQTVFGTRYLSLGPLPHLDMHYVIETPTSEPAWSSFSLLP